MWGSKRLRRSVCEPDPFRVPGRRSPTRPGPTRLRPSSGAVTRRDGPASPPLGPTWDREEVVVDNPRFNTGEGLKYTTSGLGGHIDVNLHLGYSSNNSKSLQCPWE